MVKKPFLLLIIIIGLLLAGCNAEQRTPQQLVEVTERASETAGPSSTSTPTQGQPAPTHTPQDTPTSLPTNTPTPTPPHPLSIEWLRAQDFPGSEIVIEQVLEPGSNYNQYITSYQSESLKIYALMTVPAGPAIVFNHGYIPPDQYRTTERYVAYVEAFARRGYVVFKPDYRGHGFSEGVARGGYGSPDYTVDVLNALAAVKNHPDVDPDRLGMWGHSMGGYITLRSMVVSDDIKAGVIWAGVVASYEDLLTRWRRRGSVSTPSASTRARRWRDDLITLYGSPEDNPEFWDSISANSFLEDLSGPVQLHHGTSDTSVPIEFSNLLYEQIQNVGGDVTYYTYEGDNHNLSVNFSDAMFRSITFFDTYVKGTSP
jgi:fermentation-respiration switch protein FrsA (DUF1100 family)